MLNTATDVKKNELDPSTGLPIGSPPPEGKKGVMPDGRTVEDVWAENQRKQEEITGLKSSLESVQDRLQELEEKAEEGRLTQSEKTEFKTLSEEEKYLEQEATKLENQAETKPYFYAMNKKLAEKLKEAKNEAEKIAIRVAYDTDSYHSDCFLEDKASELGMLDSSGRGDLKALAKLLLPFALRYQKEYPSRRNVLAFRDYLKDKDKLSELSKKEKEIKEKEDRLNALEGSGRMERGKSKPSFEEASKNERLQYLVDLAG